MIGSLPISTPGLRRLSRIVVALSCFVAIAVGSLMVWARINGAPPENSGDTPASGTVKDGVTAADSPVNGVPLQLTEQQRRGKQIYLTGISPNGDALTATLGNSTTEVPAGVLTCVNCHRTDGRGKAEGGIVPSNIQWHELTKSYGVNLPRGKSRPPYDESLLKRCITMGLSPEGKHLDDAMPRYRLTHRDLADLVAYLKVIGEELDPGLSADAIRIGVILAPRRMFAEMNTAVRAATSAFIEEFNRHGGVYERHIELCFSEAPEQIEDRADAVGAFVDDERPFALASSFIAGAEEDIARRLNQSGVPLIGPVTMFPQLGFPLNRFVFYLGAGLNDQGRALVKFAVNQKSATPRTAAILFPDEERLSLVASAIQSECKKLGLDGRLYPIASESWNTDDWVRKGADDKPDLVFSLLSAHQNLPLLTSADSLQWHPAFFIPGAIAGPQLFTAPVAFDRKLFLTFPTLPSLQPAGMNAHRALGERHELPAAQLGAQFDALAALQVLVHGLEQSGAHPSRERLVEKLEELTEYRSGFMPPVSYGPNRRVGNAGAFVVTIDLNNKKLVTVSDWVDGSPASLRTEN